MMRRRTNRPFERLGCFARDRSGAAASELVLWLVLLAPVLFSIVDLGAYVFQRMQVENAGQMAVQAVWANCPDPPSNGCSSLTEVSAAMNSALASTSLGDDVTQEVEAYDEGYYCPDPDAEAGDQSLTELTGGSTICPSGAAAGYYVTLTATYTFTPIVAGASITSVLPSSITYQAWSRMR